MKQLGTEELCRETLKSHGAGYLVIKKRLSYRERDLLGRSLSRDEAREVTHMARRLAAIILMEPTLNINYQALKSSCYTWPTLAAEEI